MNNIYDWMDTLSDISGCLTLVLIALSALKLLCRKLDRNRISYLEKFCIMLYDYNRSPRKLLYYLGCHLSLSLTVLFIAVIANIRFTGQEFQNEMNYVNLAFSTIFLFGMAKIYVVCKPLMTFDKSLAKYRKEISKLKQKLIVS